MNAGNTESSEARAQWLRQQRQSRGWSVPEMRRHLREAAKESGDTLPGNECLGVMIRRWEKGQGGLSERYRMHYCRAFQIRFEQFGSAPIASTPAVPDTGPASQPPITGAPTVSKPSSSVPAEPRASAPADRARIFRPLADPRPREAYERPQFRSDGTLLAHQLALTAHQGQEHAQQAERRDIGEASLEHLRSEVIRLSREYMTAEPLPLFFEMHRVREQLYRALDRKIWPRDEVELYFLLGCLSSLMADAAEDIGNPSAAEELGRSGLAYALAIDHRPLIAQLRLSLAAIALWSGHPRRSLDLAHSGLDYLRTGPNGAQLHLMIARASARLGDPETAIAKISLAAELRDADYTDDLLEIGGQFGLSRACYHYLAGTAAAELASADSEAVSHLDQSVQLYAASPGTGEDHSKHCQMIARVDLATALVHAGELEAATTTAGPVVALPPGHRISKLPKRLSRLRTELAAPRYRGEPDARDLDEQIEQFCRDTITTQLGHVSGPH